MSENNKSTRTKFHSIKVNEQIYWYLKKLEKKTGLSKQTILMNALSMYRASLTNKERFVKTQDRLDKAVWYMLKLSYAVFSFRENPMQNYQNLIEIINQIEQRLNIDLSLLEKAALEYLNTKEITNDHKINVTNALKLSLIDILENVLTSQGDNHD
jgi:DNA-directed RNA polymerase beta' subunit